MKPLGEALSELNGAVFKLRRGIIISFVICLFGAGFVLGLLLGLLI